MLPRLFGREMILETRINVMEKKTYGKTQPLKKDRLQTVHHKENILGTQKTWKLLRCLTGVLAPVSLIGLIFYGVYLWAAASAAGPMSKDLFINFEVAGEPAFLFKATVNCAIIGLILFAVFLTSCIVLSVVYKKKYKQ